MERIIVLVLLIVCSACSTPPKNPGEIDDLRKRAETQIDLGHKQAGRGSLEAALLMFNEALRLGIAADDPSLRIRAKLSIGNVLLSLGRREEAEKSWNEALSEAEQTGDKRLAAVSRIHIGRGKLLSPDGKSVAQSVRDETHKDLALIRSDDFYTAFAWTLIGLAEKELGRYADAEAAVRRGLKIHEKDRRFEMAAYDWFMIASFRSLSGNYAGARQALENAIAFDRRVENSWGLASDWRALGDVQKKAGNREDAHSAYTRAAEIFISLGYHESAAETLARIE